MKIHIIESENNKEVVTCLNKKHELLKVENVDKAEVIIVNKAYNVKRALDIVDYALSRGVEVICIKNKFGKEYYVCNYLIQNGAMYV